jgi:hypothetical protein
MRNLLILLLSTCICAKAYSQVPSGEFERNGKDYRYTLILKNDSTFSFQIAVADGGSSCDGRWHLISKNTIRLDCNELSLPEKLQRGYMKERGRTATLLGRKKIKIGQVILKRKNR